MKRGTIILIVIAALAIIGGAGYLGLRANQAEQPPAVVAPPTVAASRGDVQLSVTAPGQVINSGQVSLLSHVNGSVDEILAREGDTVHKGDVLARLGEKSSFEEAVTAAQINILQAKMALDDLNNNAASKSAEAQLALAQANQDLVTAKQRRTSADFRRGSDASVAGAEANYQLLQDSYDAIRKDVGKSTDPKDLTRLSDAARARDQALATLNWLQGKPDANALAEADAQLALAQAKVDAAQRAYDILKNGPDPDELALAQTQYEKAQSDLSNAQEALNNLEIKAPIDGIVVSVKVAAGQNVTSGMELISLIDPQALEVQSTIIEEDLPLVQPGQAAELFIDALPDAVVGGKIDRIVPVRVDTSRAIYNVYISLDKIPAHLVSGMTVDGSVIISKKANVLRLPRSVVHARADGSADIEVWAHDTIQHRSIKVGLKGDSYVEVLDGLAEGEQVVAQ